MKPMCDSAVMFLKEKGAQIVEKRTFKKKGAMETNLTLKHTILFVLSLFCFASTEKKNTKIYFGELFSNFEPRINRFQESFQVDGMSASEESTSQTKPATVGNPWLGLYVLAEYQKQPRSADVTRHVLHYLVGLRQPAATIKNWLAGVRTKEGEAGVADRLLRQHALRARLSPLMLAAALGRDEVLELLLNEATASKCLDRCLAQKDDSGFAVTHHAALSAPSLLPALYKRGATGHGQTKAGYSVASLLSAGGHPHGLEQQGQADGGGETKGREGKKSHSLSGVWWEGSDGKQVAWAEVGAEARGKVGLLEYMDASVYEGESERHALWSSPLEEDEDSLSKGVRGQAARAWGKKAPRLVVRASAELGEGQHGLFAGERLRFGSVVGPYAGRAKVATEQSFEEAMKAFRDGRGDGTSHAISVEGCTIDGRT